MKDPIKSLERDPVTAKAKRACEAARLMTPKEMASLLRVSTATVYKLVREGTLDAVRIGRLVRFRPEHYQKLLDDSAAPTWD